MRWGYGGAERAVESPLARLQVRRRRPAGFPAGYELASAELSTGRDDGAVLAVADDPDHTQDAIEAAAVRRHCGSYRQQYDAVPATAVELRRRGGTVLTVTDLHLFDPSLLSSVGLPLVPVDDDRTLRWSPATVHRRGVAARRGWLPFGQVAADWRSVYAYQPNAHPVNSAGLGAGRTPDEARELACLDLLVQDVTMTWWTYDLAADGLHRIAVPTAIQRSWHDAELGLELFAVDNVFDVPVVLARVAGAATSVLAFGGGVDVEQAAAAAVGAALTQVAELTDLDGPDRDHVGAAGPGFTSILTAAETLRLALDPVVGGRIEDRLGAVPAGHSVVESAGLSAYDALLAEGHAVWLVDVTTPEVAADGWHCFRAVVPRLARIPVAAYPVDPYGRVRQSAERLGWSTRTREKLPFPGHAPA